MRYDRTNKLLVSPHEICHMTSRLPPDAREGLPFVQGLEILAPGTYPNVSGRGTIPLCREAEAGKFIFKVPEKVAAFQSSNRQ